MFVYMQILSCVRQCLFVLVIVIVIVLRLLLVQVLLLVLVVLLLLHSDVLWQLSLLL